MKKYLATLILVAVGIVVFISLNTRRAQKPEPTQFQEPQSEGPVVNYTNEEHGYSLYLPDNLVAVPNGDFSTLFVPENQPIGPGPVNFLYISVVTPQNRDLLGEAYNYNLADYEKLISLDKVGEGVNLAEGTGQEDWYMYTLVSVEDLDGVEAKRFENTRPWEFPGGTTETRFLYDTGKNIYILGYYTGGDSGAQIDPREAYKSIKSFTRH